jgi:hypothetical protein
MMIVCGKDKNSREQKNEQTKGKNLKVTDAPK